LTIPLNQEVLREVLFNLPIVALELVDDSLCNLPLLVFSQRFFTPRIKDKALRSPILTMRTKFLRSLESSFHIAAIWNKRRTSALPK
jgi:hypothetical protein